MTTGFTQLDRLLTGMHGGELILMGARPSMGKTSIALNMAAAAARKGFGVAIFSLEMPREQIAMRLFVRRTHAWYAACALGHPAR